MANIREASGNGVGRHYRFSIPLLQHSEADTRTSNLTPVFTQIDGEQRPAYSYRAIVDEGLDGELEQRELSPLDLEKMFRTHPGARVFIQLEASEEPREGELVGPKALYCFEVKQEPGGIILVNGVEYGQTAQMKDPLRVVRGETAPFEGKLHLDDPLVMLGHPIQLVGEAISFTGPFDSEIIIGGVRTTPKASLVATVSEVLIVPARGLRGFGAIAGESSLPEMVYYRKPQEQAA